MVIRMRKNRSQTAKGRSHHALVSVRSVKCECGALRLPHIACAACGRYNGKVVIDLSARAARDARRTKRREKDLRAAGVQTGDKKQDASAS